MAAALLAACATGPAPDASAARQSWQGASYDEVRRAWGEPAHSRALPDGREERTWISEVRRSRGSIYPSVGIGVGGGSGGVGVGVGVGGIYAPIGEDVQRCERRAVFAGNQVVEQTWTGNEAYCATFGR